MQPLPTYRQYLYNSVLFNLKFKVYTDRVTVTVLLNNQLEEFFKTTVGVRQGCLLSQVLFNLFLERMQEALHNHLTFISINGRPVCNLRFADDIDLINYEAATTNCKT